MTEREYIQQLEARIERLEKLLGQIVLEAGKGMSLHGCPIGTIHTGEGCSLVMENCSIGTILPDAVDDAEQRLDDLECRLDDVLCQLDDAEAQLP